MKRWCVRGVPRSPRRLGAHRPHRYVQADVDYMARQCFFIRPAFQAALELDAEVAWDHIQASIEGGLESCTGR